MNEDIRGWRRRWTARGTAAFGLGVVLAVAGVLWRYPGVLGLGVALAALPVLALLSVLRRPRLQVRRSVRPLEVSRFESSYATLRLRRIAGLLPINVEATERIAGAPVPVPVPALRGGQPAEVAYPVPTSRRGVLRVGPLQLHRRGLIGLARSEATVAGTVDVYVLPRILPVRGLPSGVRRGHIGADERVEHGGTDLVGLREYLPGDDLRRLHWATSARTGTLMVREDADPSEAHLTLLLDDRADSYAEGDMEDAVEVVASLAVAAIDSHHGVRLRTTSGQIDVSVDATRDGGGAPPRRELVRPLAEVVARTGPELSAAGLPERGMDVYLVVTGARAELGPLLVAAGAAPLGVLAIVDPSTAGMTERITAAGPVTVLRGGRAEDVLRAWDTGVVG
jgi:uncharacterized protein (DUF58 family)